MFGYVMLDKPEMKVKDFHMFKACYCGLCRALKNEYSSASRLMLNYDCAFLYILCASQSEEPCGIFMGRCPVSLKKKAFAMEEGVAYAALINVLLGVGKLKDSIKDKGNIFLRAAALMYSRAYKKAAEKNPGAARVIRDGLIKLSEIEERRAKTIDEPADAFASLLGGIFVNAQTDYNKRVMYDLGYSIGRWIYIIDAYNDVEEDLKRGNYNPIVLRYGKEKEAFKEEVEFNLNCSIASAADAFYLLDIKKHEEILENIICSGLFKKTKSILSGEEGRGKHLNGSL